LGKPTVSAFRVANQNTIKHIIAVRNKVNNYTEKSSCSKTDNY